MPRVPRSKHHFRFHPTNFSATGATRRPFRYNSHQEQTNLQRSLVALHVIRPTVPTAVKEIFDQISAQAADNGEILGRRWNQFVHVAFSVLRKNDFLDFLIQEDGEEYCRLTQNGIQIMTDADTWFGDLWDQLSSFEKCRRLGQYVQWQISPNPIRPLTRRELDLENRELERQQQEHMKVCPMLSGSKAHQTEIPNDVMDVDGVPIAGPSTTHTPIRKPASLDYPTPQSLPRARNNARTASISPPQTPLLRNHSPGILEEDSDDGQAVAITVSNEGEVEVDRVAQVLTCHNMDWQNIVHVTAISKALQEKNHILQLEKEDLQQKMEVLEKEKEECTHQLNDANDKVGHLETEKRDLKSQSWLYRWRSTIRMTVLQEALDSAIRDRERYEQQNARLQARLDDIERRRAAIRRIEYAENAPDDELLIVIDKSLKPNV